VRAHISAILILLVLLALLAPILFIPPFARWFGAAGMSVVIVIISLFSPLYLLGSYFLSMSYRPKLMRSLSRLFKKETGTGKKQPPRE
jgi:O-antigen/teichoic acid export membrane protein